MKYGVVISFNSIKGIGSIQDNRTKEEYTFLKSDCPHEVEILDEVGYEIVTEKNKVRAIQVKLS